MNEVIKNPFYHYTYVFDENTGEVVVPDVILLDKSFHKHGNLYPISNLKVTVKANDNDETSFDFYEYYNDIRQDSYDKLKTGTIVSIKGFGLFELKVSKKDDENGSYKSVSGEFITGKELSNILVSLEVNNENDVLRSDYETDNGAYIPTVFYRDPELYDEYIWSSSDKNLTPDEKKEKLKNASLLHRIFSYAPHYTIGHIDETLYYVQKEFSWSNQTMDSVLNDIASEVSCIFTFDTYLNDDGEPVRQINAYDISYCTKCYKDIALGLNYKSFNVSKFRSIINGICSNCGESKYVYDYGEDTDIFITTENLSDSITISPEDEVKNTFKVTGGDDTITSAVQSLNFGSSRVMMFSEDEKSDMSQNLRDKLNQYLKDQSSDSSEYATLVQTRNNVLDLIQYLQSSKMPQISPDQNRDIKDEVQYVTKCIEDDYACNFYFQSYDKGEKNYKNNSYSYCSSSIRNLFTLYLDQGYTVSITNGTLPTEKESGKHYIVWDGIIKITDSSDTNNYAEIHCSSTETTYIIFNNIYKDGTDEKLKIETSFKVFIYFADETPSLYADYIKQFCDQKLASYKEVKYKNEVEKPWKEYCYERLKSFRDGYIACIESLDELDAQYPEYKNTSSGIRNNYNDILNKINDQMSWLVTKINALYTYLGDYIYTIDDYGNKTYTPDYVSESYVCDVVEEIKSLATEDGIGTYPISCKKCGSSNVKTATNSSGSEYNMCTSCGNTVQSEITTYLDIAKQVYDQLYKTYISQTIPAVIPLVTSIQSYVNKFNLENYFSKKEYLELCSFIKEQEYSNSNYTSDACYTNEDVINKAQELLDRAKNELSVACVQQLSVSTDGFAVLGQRWKDRNSYKDVYEKFTLGNWMRIRCGKEIVKARLISIDFNFDSIDTLPLEFSNVTKNNHNVLSDIKSILSQASSISSTYDYVTKQAEQGNEANTKIDDILTRGFNAALAAVLAGDNQDISIDRHGILLRKFLEETDGYSKYQMKMINRNIVMSDDAFKTSKVAIGLGVLPDGTLGYGIWADNIIGGDITCTKNLRIVGANGSVVIDGDRIHFDDGIISSSAVSGLDDSLKDFVDSIGYLQSQIDGEITSWFEDYDPSADNEPASTWETDSDKIKHEGDLFYNTATGRAFRYIYNSSTKNHEWSIVTDEAISKALADATKAKDTADRKRRVFVDTPYVPYDVGDLWAQGDKGDLYKCKIAKTDKQEYSPDDWEKATKYTDDTAWKNWASDTGDFGKYKKDIQTQLDGKSETTYGGATPPSNPETGDLWFCTDGSGGYDANKAYMYDGSIWQESDGVPDSVWDKVDGKSSIYVEKPTNGYKENDLWILESNEVLVGHSKGTVMVATFDSTEFDDSHWVEKVKYTDDTKAKEVENNLSTFKSDVEGCFGTTITSDAIISPKIGGGYLYIAKENGCSVEIDPLGLRNNNVLRIANKNDKDIMVVNSEGNATISGKIISSDAEITGGSIVISGKYEDENRSGYSTTEISSAGFIKVSKTGSDEFIRIREDGLYLTNDGGNMLDIDAEYIDINNDNTYDQDFSLFHFDITNGEITNMPRVNAFTKFSKSIAVGGYNLLSSNWFYIDDKKIQYWWQDSSGTKTLKHFIDDSTVSFCQDGNGSLWYKNSEVVNRRDGDNYYQSKSSSDFRLKKEITSLSDVESIYLSFKPKSYKFKDEKFQNNEKIHNGLIAQQVITVLSDNGVNWEDTDLVEEYECREYMDEGQYTGKTAYRINYENLHAYHIAFAQSMYKKIETLEKQNKGKDEKINDLEQRLSKLESLLLSKEGGDIE